MMNIEIRYGGTIWRGIMKIKNDLFLFILKYIKIISVINRTMTERQTRVSLKGMSEEDKKERKRIKQREYMAKRRQEDSKFADKQREYARKNMAEKRKDEEFKTKHRDYCSEYNKKKKEQTQNYSLFDRFKRAIDEYPKCMISIKDGEIWIKNQEEGTYIPQETTKQFVEKLNDIILQFRNDKDTEVDFDYEENEITVTKDGFPHFF